MLITRDDDARQRLVIWPMLFNRAGHRAAGFARTDHRGASLRGRRQMGRNDLRGIGGGQRRLEGLGQQVSGSHRATSLHHGFIELGLIG